MRLRLSSAAPSLTLTLAVSAAVLAGCDERFEASCAPENEFDGNRCVPRSTATGGAAGAAGGSAGTSGGASGNAGAPGGSGGAGGTGGGNAGAGGVAGAAGASGFAGGAGSAGSGGGAGAAGTGGAGAAGAGGAGGGAGEGGSGGDAGSGGEGGGGGTGGDAGSGGGSGSAGAAAASGAAGGAGTSGAAGAAGVSGAGGASGGSGEAGSGGAGAAGASGAGGATCAGSGAPDGLATAGEPCGTPGEKACAGPAQSTVLTCDADTCAWVTATTCGGGELCDRDARACVMVPLACIGKSPGESYCEGSVRLACAPDLTGVTQTPCSSGAHCQAGTGAACALCVDGEHACDGDVLSVCGADHQSFEPIDTCATAALCNALVGACTTAACNAGQHVCEGDELRVCNAAQDGFDSVATCDPGLCDATGGECDTCAAGTATCAGATSRTVCAPDGQTLSTEPCPAATPYCVGAGQCVACTDAAQCDAPSNECLVAACTNGTCGTGFVASGTAVAAQTANDCKLVVCNGSGGKVTQADAADVPVDDGNACTDDTCSGTSPVHPFKAAGAACGGGVCNGAGVCGVCTPGEGRCVGNVPICDDVGQWTAAGVACGGDAPACSLGGCVGVTSMALGDSFTCAVLSDQRVKCWGANSKGQVGAGDVQESLLPREVVGLSNVASVALGAGFACALHTTGMVSCWGGNNYGQLGVGGKDSNPHPVPTAVPNLTGAKAITAGKDHVCVIVSDDTVRCWGLNVYGQIGMGTFGSEVLVPTPVVNLVNVGSVDAGARHTCALEKGSPGSVHCWGSSASGQLGTGTTEGSAQPVKLATTASMIAVGDYFTCAAVSSAAISCWGSNSDSQLGPSTSNTFEPSPVVVFSEANSLPSVAAGGSHVVLWKKFWAGAEPKLYFWGSNNSGQLGLGTSGNSLATPTSGAGLTGYPSLGGSHSCAIQQKIPHCWGSNASGQLGTGDKASALTPTPVKWQ